MERAPVIDMSSPGKNAPYRHVKGTGKERGHIIIVNSCFCDRYRKTRGDDVGKPKIPGKV